MEAAILAIQVYLLVTLIDVLLAWVQPDPRRWPRRIFHWLTEPLQWPVRLVLGTVRGWDLSPLVVIGILGAIRVWLLQT